jgi:hypothetical protein
MHTKFWSGNLKKKDHVGDLGVDGGITLIWLLKKRVVMFTGFIWLRTETSGGLL